MTFIHPKSKHSKNIIQEYYPHVELPDSIPCPIPLPNEYLKMGIPMDQNEIQENNAFIIDGSDDENEASLPTNPSIDDKNKNKLTENDINQGNYPLKKKSKQVQNIKRRKFKPAMIRKTEQENESDSDSLMQVETIQKLPNESDLDLSLMETGPQKKQKDWKKKTQLQRPKPVSPTKIDDIPELKEEMEEEKPKINEVDWNSKEQPKQTVIIIKPPEPISETHDTPKIPLQIRPPSADKPMPSLPRTHAAAINPRLLKARPKPPTLLANVRAPENPECERPLSAPDNERMPVYVRPGQRPASYSSQNQEPVKIEIKSENKPEEKKEEEKKPQIEFVEPDNENVIAKGSTDQIEYILSSKKLSQGKRKKEEKTHYTVSFESKMHLGMVRNYVRIFENCEPLFSLKTKKTKEDKEIAVCKGHDAHINSSNKDGIIIVANNATDFSLREGSNIGTELVTVRTNLPDGKSKSRNRIFVHNLENSKASVGLTGFVEENQINKMSFKDGHDNIWIKLTFLGSNTINAECNKYIDPMRCLTICFALFTAKDD
ncbi:hypothetical protein TVAG_429730 [Trichomonas vaginalis G3]|uniref:Uncharacterized protein n=1 Tax=Trichomonas vaginalis (strain ATCC PRA-98 / G3) TaxID=412133 RepID=A2FKN3_TRIV3|nr:hypothetical protein TVAGG3_0403220 [Trichomonas vaginalis G3]EAX94531.1 hypothetical protein TVAG_429730 [Trichomonas vaginalis G3]KAI5534847.1 hypothetical protein TVAGG3_0403220 [Trichomonas vaginalis G3]|eukprot:XP_001307461.1 hypothetical protein [Trichomonas vaginalis G3]